MSLGIDDVIRRAWDLYRSYWRHLVPVAGAVYIVVALASALLLRSIGQGGAIVSLALTVAGFYLVQGPATVAVVDVLDGRADMSVGETIARGLRAWRVLLPAALVAGALVAIGFLLIVPGLILLTLWIAVGSVAVMEDRAGALDVLGRSRALVRGHGWQVFMIIIAVLLLGVLVGLILAAPLSLFGFAPGTVQLISQLVTAVLIVPFSAIAWVLVYLALRESKGEPPLALEADGGAPPSA